MEYLLMICSVTTTLLQNQMGTSSTKVSVGNISFRSGLLMIGIANLPQEIIKSDNVWTSKSKHDIYILETIQIFIFIVNCLRFGFMR